MKESTEWPLVIALCYHLPDARQRIRNPPIRFPNGGLFLYELVGVRNVR
jgi:hypothetical protein